MKKLAIITIYDNNNYGNRLQNYALQETIKANKINVDSLKNLVRCNFATYSIVDKIKLYIKFILKMVQNFINLNVKLGKRNTCFRRFNNNISIPSRYITAENAKSTFKNKYNFFIVGSDQIWNPNFRKMSYVDLLTFANPEQKIAFSASFGVNELPEHLKDYTAQHLKTFKAISVREEAGKKIVEDLTGKTDVEVLVDPTMLLTAQEWDKVSKKPEQLNLIKSEKYILNYFLGELPEDWKKEINRVAQENDCEIINILDKKSPFYQTGPSEFLYLEKNAFIICTDSFHSSVFSIIYDTPFVVFDRQQKGVVSMNSRIDTLLSKFKLEDRRYNGKITDELLKCDYTEAKKILEKEKQKSMCFLKRALDIKE